MATIDPVELGKWDRFETERGRLSRTLRGVWHNHIPNLFGWTVTPARLALGSTRGLGLLFISLSPIWIKVYSGDPAMSWGEAVVYSLILIAVTSYNFLYDKYVKNIAPSASAREARRNVLLELCAVMASLNSLAKRKSVDHVAGTQAACEKLLTCVRDAARAKLGDFGGTGVEASLLLFADADCKNIRVECRTTLTRPSGGTYPADQTMAYHVAKNRKHRAVHDFLKDNHPFPKTSLSGGPLNYRSILIIPLIDSPPGGPDTCVGVVTIDSSRPYRFWPGNGEEVALELQPYLSLLRVFLNLNKPHRLPYPGR